MYALNIIHMIRGLLANLVHSRHIPTVVVQGRYDVVCPVRLSHPPQLTSINIHYLLKYLDDYGTCSEEGELSNLVFLSFSLTLFSVQVFPELELHIVPDAGHSAREPGISKLLVEVCPFPRSSSFLCRPLIIKIKATDKFSNL